MNGSFLRNGKDMNSKNVNITAVSGPTKTLSMLTVHPYLFSYPVELGPGGGVPELRQFGHCQTCMKICNGYQVVKFSNLFVFYQDVEVEIYCFFCFSCFEVSTSVGATITFLDCGANP